MVFWPLKETCIGVYLKTFLKALFSMLAPDQRVQDSNPTAAMHTVDHFLCFFQANYTHEHPYCGQMYLFFGLVEAGTYSWSMMQFHFRILHMLDVIPDVVRSGSHVIKKSKNLSQ